MRLFWIEQERKVIEDVFDAGPRGVSGGRRNRGGTCCARARQAHQRHEQWRCAERAAGADQISGYNGADTIWGKAGGDDVWGGAQTDEVYGDRGADIMDGGIGHDVLKGAPGDDHMHAADSWNGDVNCGAGYDRAYADEDGDYVADNCEQVSFD